MRQVGPTPSGIERTFGDEEIIVSKTDRRGFITYANDVFVRVSGYREDELLGKPHSIIRHPEMPRIVFRVLWQTIERGEEIFAFVNNLAADGANYWVLAHISPSFDADGRIVGYHSNRRSPRRAAITEIAALYERLRAEELRHHSPVAGMEASGQLLAHLLGARDQDYDAFVWDLINRAEAA
ncbi:MAG: PAS domain-containing protein [Actinomycetota bacterium]|nr:PAS domain-containing protein [Actinomycetota bacterium]